MIHVKVYDFILMEKEFRSCGYRVLFSYSQVHIQYFRLYITTNKSQVVKRIRRYHCVIQQIKDIN